MAFWKKCSNCKTELKFKEPYQACSVSTCNHSRSGLQFCSVSCWSAHLPIYRHKEAWAVEKIAPSQAEWEASEKDAIPSTAPTSAPAQRKIISPSTLHSKTSSQAEIEKEVLVVVSKLKGYIAQKSEMSTSADVIEKLSDHLRAVCDKAISNAQSSGRKTVMARDFLL